VSTSAAHHRIYSTTSSARTSTETNKIKFMRSSDHHVRELFISLVNNKYSAAIENLEQYRPIITEDIAKQLICFSADASMTSIRELSTLMFCTTLPSPDPNETILELCVYLLQQLDKFTSVSSLRLIRIIIVNFITQFSICLTPYIERLTFLFPQTLAGYSIKTAPSASRRSSQIISFC
jgi:hypothetical protein